MNLQEFTAKLNGREYRNEITKAEEAFAKENGWLVLFGQSDDSVELRGAIYDEVSAMEGADLHFANKQLIEVEEPFEDIDKQITFLAKYGLLLEGKKVEAVWDEEKDFVWTFETDIEHVAFDVLEDGEPFCRGIVFDLNKI